MSSFTSQFETVSQHLSPVLGSSKFSKLFKTFKILLGATISLATVSVIALYKYQKFLVYPSSLNEGRSFYETPDAYGMDFEAVKITTKDGETLDCFSLKQKIDENYTNKSVILLGPNAGNISHYLSTVEIFFKYFGYNVFVYSYRGYGKSTGTPSEKGLKIDAESVLEYLAKDEQYFNSSIILYGRSLGGAVGIYMTSIVSQYYNNNNEDIIEEEDSMLRKRSTKTKELKKYPKISGVIIENTFLCLAKVIPYIFPILKNFTSLCTEKWISEVEIEKVDIDISFLFLSGLKDEIVPPNHMKLLFEKCPANIKKIKFFKKGHHNNTCNQEDYWHIVHSFIKDKIKPIEN